MDNTPVYVYADPSEFCPRHSGNSLVRRCHHFGEYYVSEMRLSRWGIPRPLDDSGYIDYVHDTKPFLVEGHWFRNSEEADRLWEALVARMLGGDMLQEEEYS